MIAGQAGLTGHLNIADEVKIGAQAGIAHDLKKKGEIVVGSPAFEISAWKRSIILFKKLPELREQILKLIKDFEAFKSKYPTSE
jgi:UDP-3-O-[3-hydroxymyristoyl] glucosamine N-acyltransferase